MQFNIQCDIFKGNSTEKAILIIFLMVCLFHFTDALLS